MAAVSVFVDDAVRGRLPPVCAKTGVPTEQEIQSQRQIGGGISVGALLLLLLLGPVGLVALVVLSIASPNAEYLTVRIPQTLAAYDRECRLKRYRLAALLLGVAFLPLAVLRLGMFPAMWLVLGVACLGAAAALHGTIRGQDVGISLDASRRWVTLTGVHPDFVRAVVAREAAAGRSLTAGGR